MQKRIPAVAAFLIGLASVSVRGQVPWDVFVDPESDSTCDVVNAANAELVVLSDTGELVVVTGPDLVLVDTFVDLDGFVFFDGFPAGLIDFAVDGDGFRTLWWIGLDGSVVQIDPLTGEPFGSDLFPEDVIGVPCDACEFWDDPGVCLLDFDEDGIPDDFDLCPDTPFGEPVDELGCACFEVDTDGDGLDDCDDECPFDFGEDEFGCPCDEFDDDLDGVDNCDDFCPNTPLNTFVTEEGCPCNEFDEDEDGINDCFDDCPGTPFGDDVDDDGCEDDDVVVVPPPVFISCGSLNSLTMISTFCGLAGLRLVTCRRPCFRAGPAAYRE